MLIKDVYLFLYTIVTTFSKQWKFTFSRHFHDIFTTFSRLFQDIFTTTDEKSRENDGTYIRFHDIFTTFSRLVPVVFHDIFTTVSRHFHHAIFTTS